MAERYEFSVVDREMAGTRFATDRAPLMMNGSTKRARSSIAVQHLCSAYRSGDFITEAAFQFDPSMAMDKPEEQPVQARDDAVSTAFATHGAGLDDDRVGTPPGEVAEAETGEDARNDQLRHQGVRARTDVLQLGPSIRLRETLSVTNPPLDFVTDTDRGLQLAQTSIFAKGIRTRRLDLARSCSTRG